MPFIIETETQTKSWIIYIVTATESVQLVLQVGMMLRGMGFDNTTSVYVAAGKIYRAEKYMAPLRQMFPLLETKDSLASQEELAPFKVSCGSCGSCFKTLS